MLKAFSSFTMRSNVVDLVVAVIKEVAFNQIVNTIVADVITHVIGLFEGTPNFSSIKLGPVCINKFIKAAVSFLIVSIAIFVFYGLAYSKTSRAGERRRNTNDS